MGAAIQAGMLEDETSDVLVVDVWKAALMRAVAEKEMRGNEELSERFQPSVDEGVEADEVAEGDFDDGSFGSGWEEV